MEMDKELLEKIRKEIVNQIAQDIIGVQPMPANTMSELYKASKPYRDLIEEGYEPVDNITKLMWVKKNDY